ncbi:MAG: glycosyl transferase family 2 [Verrucomicrobia bacterium]|nr:MAG: glycosyl transferase family 2 [Verrucomicrobiota bacterium]
MISFIVPAYNEELELSSTIAAIRAAASGVTQPYEIIVVDDASADATARIAVMAGARVISINRRQIAASRNAGARAARGEYFYVGGSARVVTNGFIPLWSRIFVRAFCTIYFGLNLGAGAFLFTTRRNFDAIGGFDEQYFIGEEVYFSLALRKLGRFKVLREPILTSGRKLRMYSARQILGNVFGVIVGGRSVACSRAKLHLWYDGKREKRAA